MNSRKIKKSLLREIFSKDTFNENNEKDERIVIERNKIMYFGINILTIILVIVGILSDTFKFRVDSALISIIIGIVNFFMLLYFCKKNIVNQMSAFSTFIWSIITLPLSISNLFLDKIITNSSIFVIAQPISIFITVILIYEIANIFYKLNMESDN